MSKLNQEQFAAATAPMGHNLIIASAGTGKTSTIVARIAHLIESGVEPRKILLLTFTNKAGAEMIGRLRTRFDERVVSGITAGTFHAVSHMLLKRLNKGVILKQPSELKTLLKSLVENRQFHHLSDLGAYGGAYLYDVYSLFCNTCVNGEGFAQWFSQNYGEQAVYADIYEDVLREFETEKARFGYADFNDLLVKMREELRAGAPIEFDEILVDEYQDTNSLQGSLIDAFATKSLFCVGDYDQSIYAFNGANIEIIGSFKDRYPDARVYSLNVNYRSSSRILELANRVIANNPRLYPKQLTVSRTGEFPSPRLLVYDELFEQYEGIAEFAQLSHYPKNDIAIIFRNNSSADGLEIALKERNIPCKRKGGVSFFESREIKALVDIIGICVNPRDIMAFIHVFEFVRGLGAARAKEIYEALSNLGHGDVARGLLSPDKDAKMHVRRAKNYELGLFDDFEEFGDRSRFSNLSLGEFAEHPILSYTALNETGAAFLLALREFLRSNLNARSARELVFGAMKSEIYAIVADNLAAKRATLKNGAIDEDLREKARAAIMAKAATLAEISKHYGAIDTFYNFLTLGKSEIEQGEGVNLLTVHASKGLEFGQVFVVDLAETRFPNAKLMAMGGSLEEERRLFYVAVTRAKDELYLSYAKHDKIGKNEYKPSQFLKEAGFNLE